MNNLRPLVLFVYLQSGRTETSKRSHYVTAGLDPRVIEISCIYDPKGGAHHHASSRRIGILVAVRPLWGRGVGIEPIHRRSRPAVMHM